MFKKKLSDFLSGDRLIIIVPLILCIFGLLMIFDASAISAIRDFHDKYHYLKRQGSWFLLGTISLVFFSFFDYRRLKSAAFPLLISSLLLLVLVLIPGIGKIVYGGRRWLQLGFIGFQPAEFAKVSLIIFFSTMFEKKKEFLPFLIIFFVFLLLIFLEPDMGTAMVLAGSLISVYYIAGAPYIDLLKIAGIGIILVPLQIILFPYRMQRLITFLNSEFDIQGASYHVRQILIALGSGGLFGRGFGQSRQKYLFLPEVSTDSIFAIIAEEFGFIGAGILILTLLFFIFKGLKLALFIQDGFGRMLIIGFISMIGFQTVANLGSMVTLLPLTGVPLPFISYGGSSLVINMSAVGIIYNISRINKS